MNAPHMCIGIVGGMSPESTVTYYQRIVHRHEEEIRDHAYPRVVIASVSFQQYVDFQEAGEWERIADLLQDEFASVAAAGADFIVLATNTMHKVLPRIECAVPVLSITDVVAHEAKRLGVRRLGLTGTRFTMQGGFYADALRARGLEIVLPDEAQQARIHAIIYDELIRGVVTDASRAAFLEITESLPEKGAERVLLGCTELEQLVRGQSWRVGLLDATTLHADAAWEAAVGRTSLGEYRGVDV